MGKQGNLGGSALNAIRGAQNRAAGKLFEQVIQAACDLYRQEGVADIDKTPEPTKQIGAMGRNGRFQACYEKRAQPDFKGTVDGGKSVVFEAKFTSSDRMDQDVVLPQQAESLERHSRLGAACFIVAGFGLDDCYRVPWAVWRNMKTVYGRKYVTRADIEKYRVERKRGILDFLMAYHRRREADTGEA